MYNGFKVLVNLKLSYTYNNTTCINVFNYLASGLSSVDYEPRKIPLYPLRSDNVAHCSVFVNIDSDKVWACNYDNMIRDKVDESWDVFERVCGGGVIEGGEG